MTVPLVTSPISQRVVSAYYWSLSSSFSVIVAKRPSVRFLVFKPNNSHCAQIWTCIGRVELRTFLMLYLFTLPLQLITTGSLLEQGSTALIALTAVHAGAVVALFWALLANAIVATQVVEDGTLASLVVRLPSSEYVTEPSDSLRRSHSIFLPLSRLVSGFMFPWTSH